MDADLYFKFSNHEECYIKINNLYSHNKKINKSNDTGCGCLLQKVGTYYNSYILLKKLKVFSENICISIAKLLPQIVPIKYRFNKNIGYYHHSAISPFYTWGDRLKNL